MDHLNILGAAHMKRLRVPVTRGCSRLNVPGSRISFKNVVEYPNTIGFVGAALRAVGAPDYCKSGVNILDEVFVNRDVLHQVARCWTNRVLLEFKIYS